MRKGITRLTTRTLHSTAMLGPSQPRLLTNERTTDSPTYLTRAGAEPLGLGMQRPAVCSRAASPRGLTESREAGPRQTRGRAYRTRIQIHSVSTPWRLLAPQPYPSSMCRLNAFFARCGDPQWGALPSAPTFTPHRTESRGGFHRAVPQIQNFRSPPAPRPPGKYVRSLKTQILTKVLFLGNIYNQRSGGHLRSR